MPWVCLHKGIPHIAIQKGKEKVNLTYSGGEVCAIKNQVELSTQKKKNYWRSWNPVLILLLIDFLKLQCDLETQILFTSLSVKAKWILGLLARKLTEQQSP